MLQMLQNKGGLKFEDLSDALNPDFDRDSNEMDYNLQMVDLDGSGIDSYLSGKNAVSDLHNGQWVPVDQRHGNFLLVNDGTGRLHVALKDEFIAWGRQAAEYAAQQYNDSTTLYAIANEATPGFHGYLTEEDKLNFVAAVSAFKIQDGVNHMNASVLVNVPVRFDLRTAFTDPITITDRNGSQFMRTFAGNDRIYDTNHAEVASIDGGLGPDTAVYSETEPATH